MHTRFGRGPVLRVAVTSVITLFVVAATATGIGRQSGRRAMAGDGVPAAAPAAAASAASAAPAAPAAPAASAANDSVQLALAPAAASVPDDSKLPPIPNPASVAEKPDEMKAYREQIPGTNIGFDLLPIPGGKFMMGSPESEADRKEDEGPQREVEIAPFWMAKCETTWDEYDIWSFSLDVKRRNALGEEPTIRDGIADVVTRPTKPYTDMTFGMGHDRYPAICMTGLAAQKYCEWLSAKTGRYYRLPTEAEWEYACRAGTTTAYSWGDDPAMIGDYAWYIDNIEAKYSKVGLKKPNPWGLLDMHGNVAEWCLDQYAVDSYARSGNVNPYIPSPKEYPQVVRGGSYEATADECRSARREFSNPDWKIQDPQLPKSKWYHTDARFVGFRVVRPLNGQPPVKSAEPK